MSLAKARKAWTGQRRKFMQVDGKSRQYVDVSGERYGRLVAIRLVGPRVCGSQIKSVWSFKCDCGTEVERLLMHVRAGYTHSCGCERREVAGKRYRLASGVSSFRALIDTYSRRAAFLGVEFLLTEEQFRALTASNCRYCNAIPSQVKLAASESYGSYTYNGLDRQDNALGYTIENAVPCCGTCNRAKNIMGVAEFRAWIIKVNRWASEERGARCLDKAV